MKRCSWNQIGRPVCGKPATHAITLDNGAVLQFCAYHTGVARRDGWTGLKKIKPAGLAATPSLEGTTATTDAQGYVTSIEDSDA